MSKPKRIELKIGDIWGVLPLEKTLEVRTISGLLPAIDCEDVSCVVYHDVGTFRGVISESRFHSWITRKKAILIGRYDFKTGKAVTVKGGKK